MTLREEITLLAIAALLLLAGGALGAAGATIARALGTPTTSAAIVADAGRGR